MDLETIKQIGIRAAYRAGRILNKHFGKITQVTKKGVIDLVTTADIESERTILETIREKFPNHTILAEESGESRGDAPCRWIIDPLDGTTNFSHNLGIYSVSIAYAEKDQVVMGIVFNPGNGELFTALRGQGAQLNDRPIRVSDATDLTDSLLVTGFPYNIRDGADLLIQRFTKFLLAAQGIRRLGSAALDLCYVACGRFDGFWENHLKPWDTAAGALIAQEAGGRVTDYMDRPFRVDGDEILATNGRIHQKMLALLQP